MRKALVLHPDSTCDAVKSIDVDIARLGKNDLSLHYSAGGQIADLLLAAPALPQRTDELWRTTCFEAFFALGDAYTEFNFAPSTAWASYRFTGYRQGMKRATDLAAPSITIAKHAHRFELTAILTLPELFDADRLALSAVIEETDGRKSYWALAHPPGKPDFHHAIAFAHELKASSA